MLTNVTANKLSGTHTTFTVTVPGQQNWQLRSVYAAVTRGTGGTPGRYYTLAITDQTNTVATVAAADAGTDPGTCTVTWADVSASATSSGSVGVSAAPIPKLVLPAAYQLVVTINNPVAGDTFTQVNCWYDYNET